MLEKGAGRRRLLEDRARAACRCRARPLRSRAPDCAKVTGVDLNGEPVVVEGTGYFARCLQHETDHLDGQLYIDRLTKRQRRSVLEEMNDVMEDVFKQREMRAREIGAENRAG